MMGSIEKAQACLSKLEVLLSKWNGRFIKSVSLSTGVASNKNSDDIDAVIFEADKNMYECKRNHYINIGVERRYY